MRLPADSFSCAVPGSREARASIRVSIEPNTRAPAALSRCVLEVSVPASPNTSAPACPIDTPSFASRPAISA